MQLSLEQLTELNSIAVLIDTYYSSAASALGTLMLLYCVPNATWGAIAPLIVALHTCALVVTILGVKEVCL